MRFFFFLPIFVKEFFVSQTSDSSNYYFRGHCGLIGGNHCESVCAIVSPVTPHPSVTTPDWIFFYKRSSVHELSCPSSPPFSSLWK